MQYNTRKRFLAPVENETHETAREKCGVSKVDDVHLARLGDEKVVNVDIAVADKHFLIGEVNLIFGSTQLEHLFDKARKFLAEVAHKEAGSILAYLVDVALQVAKRVVCLGRDLVLENVVLNTATTNWARV